MIRVSRGRSQREVSRVYCLPLSPLSPILISIFKCNKSNFTLNVCKFTNHAVLHYFNCTGNIIDIIVVLLRCKFKCSEKKIKILFDKKTRFGSLGNDIN